MLTPTLPELSETEDSEEEEDGRGEKGKEMSAEKGKKSLHIKSGELCIRKVRKTKRRMATE